jgi:hypothetical protein
MMHPYRDAECVGTIEKEEEIASIGYNIPNPPADGQQNADIKKIPVFEFEALGEDPMTCNT